MHRWYSSFFLFFLFVCSSLGQSPKREMRAVWLATVGGLDWPSSTNASTQQAQLSAIFDDLQQKQFTTVIFQVRARGNAFYNSSYEPWAGEITGNDSANLGVAPGYDPLTFAISKAREHGLEIHAWFNFGIVWNNTVAPVSADSQKPHVAAAHPEWVKSYGGNLWLDPGIPEVRSYLRMVALDLVRNYDIDGIHFDFIRIANSDFPDDTTFLNCIPCQNDSATAGLAAWRRENINIFMREFYDSLMMIKPWVKVGSAPIGIYSPIPGASSSFNGYQSLGQDSREWMKEGKHDYVMPQIYWNFGEQPSPYDPDFRALLLDWQNNRFGKHVYPGLPAYRMAPSDGNYPIAEMIAMIDSTRYYGALGNVFFRYGSLSINNFKNSVTTGLPSRYTDPALIPLMPWKDDLPPNKPDSFKVERVSPNISRISWMTPQPAFDGETARQYVVYRWLTLAGVTYSDPLYIFYKGPSTSVTDVITPGITAWYSATALDRVQNESVATTIWGINSDTVLVSSPAPEVRVTAFALSQNYPNPFNPATWISYTVPMQSLIRLRVFDVLGRQVRILYEGQREAGEYREEFDASGLPSGVYFYRLEAGGMVQSRKMLLVR